MGGTGRLRGINSAPAHHQAVCSSKASLLWLYQERGRQVSSEYFPEPQGKILRPAYTWACLLMQSSCERDNENSQHPALRERTQHGETAMRNCVHRKHAASEVTLRRVEVMVSDTCSDCASQKGGQGDRVRTWREARRKG